MTQADFLKTANGIGARLCRDAVWSMERCNWLGDSMEHLGGRWQVVHRNCGPEFYSGTSGIALLLARLYAINGDRVFRATARAAAHHAFAHREEVALSTKASFYCGWAGICYALLWIGEIIRCEQFVEQGIAMMQALRDVDPSTQGADVTAGCAGAIPVLLQLGRRFDMPFARDTAIRYGEHLIDIAQKGEQGWSWPLSREAGYAGLTGFSHGSAGFGWALLELYDVCGEDRFREAAEKAFAFERGSFDVQYQNWPDLRGLYDPLMNTGVGPVFMNAWCHGAPGIGLSRLRAYELTHDERYRDEARAALTSTAASIEFSLKSQTDNFSMCHGLGGNADIVATGGRTLGDARFASLAQEVAQAGLERFELSRNAWPCGVPDGGETPGLMLGVAGIAHFYLRLADNAIPSILLISDGLSCGL
jgi:lantibiotic biosynthesis protein